VVPDRLVSDPLIIPGTSLAASRLGLGTESLHRLGAGARRDLLAAAYDAGVRYFDTAPLYGHGIAERELGLFAAARRAAGVESVLLATKVGRVPNPWLMRRPALVRPHMVLRALARKLPRAARGDAPQRFEPAWLRTSVEGSLARLAIDALDIVYLHEPTLARLGDADAVAAALTRLKADGKTRCIGMSGRLQDLLPIAARYPMLAEVLQIDAAAEAAAGALQRIARPMQVSFEHLRAAGPADGAAVMAAAQRFNPAGVIVLATSDRHQLLDCARALLRAG
jgi:D-threo-aldose 1-dehydrogenase